MLAHSVAKDWINPSGNSEKQSECEPQKTPDNILKNVKVARLVTGGFPVFWSHPIHSLVEKSGFHGSPFIVPVITTGAIFGKCCCDPKS